jgi:hypothetical protein
VKQYISRLVAAICLGVLLCGNAYSQTPIKREPFKIFTASDGAYWGGVLLDLASSVNKREANPLLRDSSGIFAPGKNIAFKGSIWGAFKLLEWRYDKPSERRTIRGFKIGAGFVWGALAVRNFRIRPAR